MGIQREKVVDGINGARVLYPEGLAGDTHGATLEFKLESGKVATVACSVSPAPAPPPAPATQETPAVVEPAEPKPEAIDTGEEAKGEGEAADEAVDPESLKGALPDEFPYLKELGAADPPVHTYAQVRRVAKAGKLTEITGIGEKGEVKILAALGIEETALE